MRVRSGLWLGLLLMMGCHEQTSAPGELPANLIIPREPPVEALSEWRDAAGRSKITRQMGDVVLRGFRYAGRDAKAPTLLFFNGNGMTILASDSLYRQLAALGPTVVVYDYRGYGFSSGKPDMAAFRDDAVKLYDSIATTRPPIVYGFSMGTAVASYLASVCSLPGLILAAPIASAAEEVPVYLKASGVPTDYIATHKPAADAVEIFGEAAMLVKSKAPLLVLHGKDDFLIPVEQAREVLAASGAAQKRLAIIPDADHNATPGDPDALTAVKTFLSGLD